LTDLLCGFYADATNAKSAVAGIRIIATGGREAGTNIANKHTAMMALTATIAGT